MIEFSVFFRNRCSYSLRATMSEKHLKDNCLSE